MKILSVFGLTIATLLLNLTPALFSENLNFSIVTAQTVDEKKAETMRMTQVGYQQYNSGQFLEAEQTWQKVLKLHQENKDIIGISYVTFFLASNYERLSEYEKAIDYYQQSLSIKETIGEYKGADKTSLLTGLGDIYLILGQYDKAIDYFQESLAISKKSGNRYQESMCLNYLGNVYLSLKEYNKATDYYQQSLVIGEEIGNLGDRLGVATSFLGLGSVYNSLEEYDKAIDYYEKALAIFVRLRDASGISESLINLGVVYTNLEKYDKAMEYYQITLVGVENSTEGFYSQKAIIHNNIAELLNKKNQPSDAISYYRKSIELYEKIRQNIKGLSKEEQEIYLNNIAYTYRNFADLLRSQERQPEAEKVLELLKKN